MGKTGARYSDEIAEVVEDFIDAIAPLGEISWRKMFGGAGIYCDGKMFALVDSEAQLHLKVDDRNRAQFEEAGSAKLDRMPYYAVPDAVVDADDERTLLDWARESMDIATG